MQSAILLYIPFLSYAHVPGLRQEYLGIFGLGLQEFWHSFRVEYVPPIIDSQPFSVQDQRENLLALYAKNTIIAKIIRRDMIRAIAPFILSIQNIFYLKTNLIRLKMNEPHIALVMMLKNEQKRLHVTLNSVIGFVDSMVIYDTGSTDNTVSILEEFSVKHGIPLHLLRGDFVDFGKSRNACLEFADSIPEIDYYLLMDCNDELRGGPILRTLAKKYISEPNIAFLIKQEWWSGVLDRYFNVRFIKARAGWMYRHRVHEWLKNTTYDRDEDGPPIVRVDEELILFQDRTQDDDKTGRRFARDYDLLLEDHREDPTEPRIVFYLAQTCACLDKIDEAFYYYKLRTTLVGFWEERYHAYSRCGDLSEKLGHPWKETMGWYIQAYEFSPRAEPILSIAKHYILQKNWLLAFTFTDLACKLTYPTQCHLFVDRKAYDYERWHWLGVCGHYSGFHTEGKLGCKKAVESEFANEVDRNNARIYGIDTDGDKTTKDETIKDKIVKNETKKDFLDKVKLELSKSSPNLTSKQIESRAKLLWKSTSREKSS